MKYIGLNLSQIKVLWNWVLICLNSSKLKLKSFISLQLSWLFLEDSSVNRQVWSEENILFENLNNDKNSGWKWKKCNVNVIFFLIF